MSKVKRLVSGIIILAMCISIMQVPVAAEKVSSENLATTYASIDKQEIHLVRSSGYYNIGASITGSSTSVTITISGYNVNQSKTFVSNVTVPPIRIYLEGGQLYTVTAIVNYGSGYSIYFN